MSDVVKRRAFLGAVAGSAVGVLAAAGDAGALDVRAPDDWLKNLTGKHRQVFDAVSPNDGFAMIFAKNFLDTTPDGGAVVVLRHFAIPYAFNDEVWAKYKLGAAPLNIVEGGKEATSNSKRTGSLAGPDASIEKLIARGVSFGVCNLALGFLSGLRAKDAGVTAEVARREWVAGLLPGLTIIPSGVWGVNNAQEHGCSYCYAG